jgi:hypothetical protein
VTRPHPDQRLATTLGGVEPVKRPTSDERGLWGTASQLGCFSLGPDAFGGAVNNTPPKKPRVRRTGRSARRRPYRAVLGPEQDGAVVPGASLPTSHTGIQQDLIPVVTNIGVEVAGQLADVVFPRR